MRLFAVLLALVVWTSPCTATPHGAHPPVNLPSAATETETHKRCMLRCEQKCSGACHTACVHHCKAGPAKKADKRTWWQSALDQISGDGGHTGDVGLLIYPTVGYAPETKWEFGFSSVYVYFASNDPTNRLSELSAFTFVTQQSQYGLQLEHTLYSDHNEWFFYGKVYLQSFPLKFYGIGPSADKHEKALVEGNFALVRERVLRKLKGSLYLGLALDIQRMSSVEYEKQPGYEDMELPLGYGGSSNFGLGLGLVYDTCHNAMNVRDGVLAEVGFLSYPSWVSDFAMTTLYADGRYFFPTTSSQVLAFHVTGDFTFGQVPFNQLAQIGGSRIMRGFYTGRFRDRNAIAAQVEYRWLPVAWRIGGAAFASVGSVAPDLGFNRLLWSVGGGPRILLFPQKDIYVRIDVAYTPFTFEKFASYIYIGEAF
ncbi:MAG: BamA/TamA family outer membrane protein [Myxococcales bacterium]|nr:BamA/TamA family outer membrane protein [Myxococcales bacterium]